MLDLINTLTTTSGLVKSGYYIIKPIGYIWSLGKKRLERNIKTFRLLKKLSLTELKDNFDSVYFHSLYEYSNVQSYAVIALFANEEVIRAFKTKLYEKNDTGFIIELDAQAHTNPSLRAIKSLDIDIKNELNSFVQIFQQIVQKTRNPKEIEERETALDTNTMVKELLARSKGIDEELLNELDYPKELIREGNTQKALDFLIRIKKQKWDKASSDIRRRILINIGNCYLNLHREKEAGHAYLELSSLSINTAEINGLIAFGYALLKDKSKFDLAFSKTKELETENEDAYMGFILLQESGNFEEIEDVVPRKLHSNVQICYALSVCARKLNSPANGIKWLRTALDHVPQSNAYEIKGALGSALLETFNHDRKAVTGQISTKRKNIIEEAIVLLSEAWEKVKDTDLKSSRYYWILNRGIAHKLLGHFDKAYLDIREATAAHMDFFTARHLVIICIETNKTDEALEILSNMDFTDVDSDERMGVKLLQIDVLIQKGNFTEAQNILDSLVGGEISDSHNEEIKSLQITILLGENKIEDAKQLAISNIEARSDKASGYYNMSRVLKKLENQEEVKYLINAIQYLQKEDDFLLRINIFLRLYELKEFELGVSVIEPVISKDAVSPFLQKYLACYFELNRYDEVIRICKAIRDVNEVVPFLIEIELASYIAQGRLAEAEIFALDVAETFPKPSIIYIRLAHVYGRQMNIERLKTVLLNISETDFLPLQAAFELASLYLIAGMIDEAMQLAYKTRRKYYNDPESHKRYFFFTTNLESEGPNYANEEDVISIGNAVTLEYPNGELKTYIIESGTVDIQFHEISENNPLAKSLLGRAKGDIIEIESSFGPNQKVIIKAINSKYFFAAKISVNLISTDYLGQFKDLSVLTFSNDPKEAVGDLQRLIHEQLSANEVRKEEVKRLYEQRIVPISVLAKSESRNFLEAWFVVISDPDFGIHCNLYTEQLAIGLKNLSEKSPIIIDLISLATLAAVDGLDLVLTLDSQIIISQSTLDVLTEFLIAKKFGAGSKGHMTVFIKDGQTYRHEISAEAIKKNLDFVESIINWCKQNAQIKVPHTIKEGRVEEIRNILGEHEIDTIFLAIETKGIIYAEEFAIRAVANSEHNINGVSTHAFLQYCLNDGKISKKDFDDKVLRLIQMGYKGLYIDHAILLECLRKANWTLGYPFTLALECLSADNCNEDWAIGNAVLLIRQIYLTPDLLKNRSAIIMAILGHIEKGRDRKIILQKLVPAINAGFRLLPEHKNDLFAAMKIYYEYK